MNSTPSHSSGLLAAWFGNGPWRSKSVLIAVLAILIGGGFWLSGTKKGAPDTDAGPANHLSPTTEEQADGKPLPAYVLACASYVAGYCVGWFFRRVFRMLLFVVALAIGLLALGQFTGYDLQPAREQAKNASEWAKRELDSVKEQLKHMLPSATGAGIGLFLGFRRRSHAKPAASGGVD